MQSIWTSLLWKEWCEFRWKLAALTGVMALLPLLCVSIFRGNTNYEWLQSAIVLPTIAMFPYAIVAGLLIAMSVSAGENSRRTMRFLQALPTPMWQAAAVKLIMAIITVSVPIVVLVATQWLIVNWYDSTGSLQAQGSRQHINQFGWYFSNFYVGEVIVGILGVCSFLIWGVATGVNRSDEVRAGAVSFLAIAGLWLVFVCVSIRVEKYIHPSKAKLGLISIAALPGGLGFVSREVINTSRSGLGTFALVAFVSHTLVAIWFLKRFGRVAMPPKHNVASRWNFRFGSRSSSLPLRTPLAAIAWKQVRETGPLTIFAAAGILAIVPLIYWWNQSQGGNSDFSEMLAAVTMSVGVMVAMVVGIGVLLEDYATGVNNFWRSRPINLHAWFAIKYVAGFVVLVFSFGPLLIFAATLENWEGVTFTLAAFTVAAFLGIYTIAVAGYALLRQPIYTAILTFIAIFGLMVPIDTLFPSPSYLWRGVLFYALCFIATISLAWQAVVRDWGWKQSR